MGCYLHVNYSQIQIPGPNPLLQWPSENLHLEAPLAVKLDMPQITHVTFLPRNLLFCLDFLMVISMCPVFSNHLRDSPLPIIQLVAIAFWTLPSNTLDPAFPAWMLVTAS